ncbi:MAG: LPS export ABC transporter periplasmic protein LptC [Burkholderiaceae bacterium]
MNARLYDRLAAFASITFLLVLAAGTYYLAVWVSRDLQSPVVVRSNEPDVFVEGVSLTRVDANGEPVFQMSAASMLHFPIDGSSRFTAPVLISLDQERPTMTVRADTATASASGKSTVLEGNVILERQAHEANPLLRVLTERLTLTSDNEMAETDLPVRIEHGNAVLTGTGMRFDNLKRTLELMAAVNANLAADDVSTPGAVKTSPSGDDL